MRFALSLVAAVGVSLSLAAPATAAPAAVTDVMAVPSIGGATVFWTSTGPATGYVARCVSQDGTFTVQKELASSSRSHSFSPLPGGVSFTCAVASTSATGTSDFSSAAPVVVFGVPGTPTLTAARPADAALIVDFTAPTSNGGAAILDYRITCGDAVVVVAASPATVPLPGVESAVACTARARNAVGLSGPSISLTATPGQRPSAVRITSVGVPAPGSLRVAVAATTSAVTPVTKFTVTCWSVLTSESVTASASASPVTLTGVKSGDYTCVAVAENVYGPSSASPPSRPAGAIPDLPAPKAPVLTWKHNSSGAALSVTFERSTEATAYILSCAGPADVTKTFPDPVGTFTVAPGKWSCKAVVQVGEFESPASAASRVVVTPATPKLSSPGKGRITISRPAGLKAWTASCSLEGAKAVTKQGNDATISLTSLKAGLYTCKASGNDVSSETATIKVA